MNLRCDAGSPANEQSKDYRIEAHVEAVLAELEAALGHSFARPELLVRALTHRSLANERAARERHSSSGQTEVRGNGRQ